MPFKRLDVGSEWTTRDGSDEITESSISHKLKQFRSRTMFYTTGTPDNDPSSVGIGRLSFDDGENWTDVTPPAGNDGCLDMAEASDGILWGLFYDSTTPGSPDGYTACIAWSDDGGSVWTSVFTLDPGQQAFNIACSPTGTRIAVTAR